MKAYSKTLFRMLKRHLGRFLAVTAIIALGIGFMTGLGSVKPKLIGTLDKYYSDRAGSRPDNQVGNGFFPSSDRCAGAIFRRIYLYARDRFGCGYGRKLRPHTVYAAFRFDSEQAGASGGGASPYFD